MFYSHRSSNVRTLVSNESIEHFNKFHYRKKTIANIKTQLTLDVEKNINKSARMSESSKSRCTSTFCQRSYQLVSIYLNQNCYSNIFLLKTRTAI
jgi:hypothetical protein